MAYFTSDQVAKAKKIDLLSYLQTNNPDELLVDSRNSYKTKTHDSLKISNGMWYWFSRGVGGKSALDYLITVENYSFKEAVAHLLKLKIVPVSNNYVTKNREERLILPKKSKDNSKVLSYLISRGISKNIILQCLNKCLIYQEQDTKNVVFVGFDYNGFPRYAGIRGTNKSRYMRDAYGSNKTYSFRMTSVKLNNSVHIFESAIDLLSFATIKEMKNQKWDEENLLALAGIYKPAKNSFDSKTPKALDKFLEQNPNVDTIILHLDNDIAGKLATEGITNSLSDRYKVINDPAKFGKDYNDYLLEIKKNLTKNSIITER